MARAKRARRRLKASTAATDRGSMLIAAFLVALLALLCLAVVERGALALALTDVRQRSDAPSPTTIQTLTAVIAVPITFGIIAAAVTGLVVPGMRESLYLRSLHRFLASYLRTYARIGSPEATLRGVRFDAQGLAPSDSDQPLIPTLASASRLLVLGEPGIGKTFALYSLAYELTRKRRVAQLPVRRRRLPVLIHLPAYAFAFERTGTSFRQWVGEQLAAFGTPGLAARLPALTRQRRFLLLCDGLDDVPAHLRGRVCEDLHALIAAKSDAQRVVVTCRLDLYTRELRRSPALREFERMVVADLDKHSVERVLLSAKSAQSSAKPRRAVSLNTLAGHALADSVEVPAQLAALLAVSAGEDTPLYGPGELAKAFVASACDTIGRRGCATPEARRLLGALASALRQEDRHTLPVNTDQSAGEAVGAWLAAYPPPAALETSVLTFSPASADVLDNLIEGARAAGVLRMSSDGHSIGFDNAVCEAAFAADWLASADDALGRANPDLLRPPWTQPVILWGSSAAEAADVAQRLLRLADAPDATAARAALTSGAETLPVALALALGVMVEGQEAALARIGNTEGQQEAVDAIEQHLRDVLDLVHAQIAVPEQSKRQVAALRRAAELAGAEYVGSIGRLARSPLLGRLVRGELVAVLGSIGSPAAVTLVTELLGEADPVIGQAVTQALIAAGLPALTALRSAAHSGDERTQGRANAIMAHFGDAATQTALAGLSDPNAPQRVAAIRTIGTLGATSAVAAVIERLDDESTDVRAAAAQTLGQLGTASAVAALVHHAADDDAGVRAAVAHALSGQEDLQAEPALIQLLGDKDAHVRAAAATALGAIATPSALDALERHRMDGDPLARNAVQQALQRLGRPRHTTQM